MLRAFVDNFLLPEEPLDLILIYLHLIIDYMQINAN
ncbi:hypothetical protein P368_10500 [Comamonas thiooxydans]|nr:hypothetical protein P365_12315 [Comamonas thiooxydans]KGH12976.1 hypothetical protein P368_10500 [Comamonas thiooxydans]